MRDKLRAIEGRRARYRAVFDQFHQRTSYGHVVKTLMLRDVTDAASGREICDHLWFRRGKQWDDLQLQPGDRVEFEARSGTYLKGYGPPEEKRLDYCLKNPTQVKRLTAHNSVVSDLPLFALA